MDQNYQLKDIFLFLRKKWYIIFFTVLGSILLFIFLQFVFEVNKNSKSVTWEYGAIVKYPEHNTYLNENGIERYYDYTTLWYRSPILSQFVSLLNETYAMSDIVEGWEHKNQTDQLAWVRQHFRCESLPHTEVYEFIFLLNKENADKNSLEDGEKLLADFIDFASKTLSTIGNSHLYEIEWKSEQVSEIPAISNRWITLKYAIIGGIFGILLSVFGLVFFFTIKKSEA